MHSRLDIQAHVPELFRKYIEFSMSVRGGSIDAKIHHLMTLRASQINGCAFCVDMHVKEAKIAGERELRLHHVAIWRESVLFSPRERAALAWTEALTRLSPEHGVPDDVYAMVSEQFNEQELGELAFIVIAINGWNRLSVAFRKEPGSADDAYGLKKAGLS